MYKIDTTVQYFLINYEFFQETDIFSSKNSLSQSAEQMAVATIVQCEASRANSILFSSINNDSAQYDIQYTRYL